jgi:hypothetical protein
MATTNETAEAARRRLELQGLHGDRMLSLAEAAQLTSLSEDTLRRRYSHLIRKLSPRRCAIRLRDALAIGNAA